MLLPFYVALSVALVFYAILPVIGGYLSRAQWRGFRERLIELSLAPRLKLGDVFGRIREDLAPAGRHRLYGAIEAIEGEDRIWVRSEGLTAIVDLGRAWFYQLPHEGPGEEGRYSLVERMPWSRVRVFPEGAKVFVGGAVRIEGGKPLFAETPDESLIVVSYEGEESTLLSRLVAGGRLGNEYWNAISRVSLAMGIGIMGIYLTIAGAADYFPTVIFLSFLVALMPALCLFPPGLVFFFLYLRLWRRGLAARTLRDLLRLPLRFFVPGDRPGPGGELRAPLPEGGFYRMAALPGGPPAGMDILRPGPGVEEGGWVGFEAEDSDDPAARRMAIAGDPELLARRSDREALVATVASGLSLGLGIAINLMLAVLLWRLL